jgi:preprotein translocase subunit YajC
VALLIILVLVLAVSYVVLIRPQRQRQAEHQLAIENAEVGDEILTTGGIYGTIMEADGDDIVVDLAPSGGMPVHMTRRGIAVVLPPEGEEEADEEAEDADEAVVTDDEEAVRSGTAGGPAADEHG